MIKLAINFIYFSITMGWELHACPQRIEEINQQKPNIVIFLADDISYKDLSSYGQCMFSTPNLDKLAVNGLKFNQAYSGSSECAPSRASILTGMHMGHCRIRANNSVRGQDHLNNEDITIAEVLKQAGYTTGFIGKWGVGLPGTEGTPDRQGFDFSYGYYDQFRAHGYFPHYLMRNGKAEPIPANYSFNMERVYKHTSDITGQFDNTYNADGKIIADGVKDPEKVQYSEDLFEREALNFIEINSGNPFFLYYATQLPHGPLIASELGNYKDEQWDIKHKEWASMVTRMDKTVGNMISQLEKFGQLENTIFFFAGDNGYSQWGYFGRGRHEDDTIFRNKGPWPKGKFTCTHEGGMRVPFFVYWKDKISPGESNHVCVLYDILATAAELAGVTPPDSDGISLLPLLTGNAEKQAEHEYLYWENGTFSPHAQSVRSGQWWAYRNHPSEPVKLYDVTCDINCEHDLAESNQRVVKRVKNIFKTARFDSKWYINPGEGEEIFLQKRKEAESLREMQIPVRANTVYKDN